MNHRIVRLSSGEEILCDLLVTGDSYILKDPAIIIPTGDGNIGLAHWLPYAENKAVKVSAKYVVFVVEPVPQLDSNYNAMMSPIILPPKDIVAPVGEVTA
jgi:hypothetical protein